jgi:G3E family GTPase
MAGSAPLADIPANVVAGEHGAGTFEFIRAVLALRPAGERWAVLRNSPGTDGTAVDAAGSRDIQFSSVSDGCICCSAQTELRVALTRLLRESRPHRLIVEPSPQARLSDVLGLLADRWFGPVLALRSTIMVVDASGHVEPGQSLDEQQRERFATADIVAIRGGGHVAPATMIALRNSLSGVVPGAQLIDVDREQLKLEYLDRVARVQPRPRFRS